MTQLVLTEEQAKVAASALRPLEVHDTRGNVVGTFSPIWTAADITEAKNRLASSEPRYTTAQVLEYLRNSVSEPDRLVEVANVRGLDPPASESQGNGQN